MSFAAIILALVSPLCAQDSAKSDEAKNPPHLTPYQWQKPAPTADSGSQDAKSKFQKVPSLSERAKDDEIVCEQGVVHPTEAQPGDVTPASVLGGPMGVQHCWKKSDPNTIIKRPKTNADFLSEAVGQALDGTQVNSISGPGFKPMKKPVIPRKGKARSVKRQIKAAAPEPAAPAPAPEKKESQGSGETPTLLR